MLIYKDKVYLDINIISTKVLTFKMKFSGSIPTFTSLGEKIVGKTGKALGSIKENITLFDSTLSAFFVISV